MLVFKKIIKFLFCSATLLLVLICLAYYIISCNAKDKLFNNADDLPKNNVGLLLGTSKYLRRGRINLFYKYRLESAVELFKLGKINYILVSGDNATHSYDEPTTFKKDLLKMGVPADKIVLDYAGFRTLDSVVRAKEVFGQESFTIISQEFHNERAIYLAEYFGVKAIGYNAKSVPKFYGMKVILRECLARVKVFIDIIIGKQPKFLGDKIIIGS